MDEVWILTLVRTPSEGLTDRFHFVFGGAGALPDLSDALIRNAGDVWDNWYDYAAVEHMAGVLALPGDAAVEARWFRLVCPDGTYASARGEPCARPDELLPAMAGAACAQGVGPRGDWGVAPAG